MKTETAAIIKDLIATGRIVEARTLLTVETAALDAEELHACNREIEQRQTQAEALIALAETMESAGQIKEAKAVYESVLLVAVDFPGIQEHIRRMDEALLLTRAVQRRSQRIRESLPSRKGAAKKRTLPLLGAGLAAGLAAATLFLLLDKPHLPQGALPEKAALQQPVPTAGRHSAHPPAVPAPEPVTVAPPPAAPEEKPAAPDPEPAAIQQPAITPASPVPTQPETQPAPPEPVPPPTSDPPQPSPLPLSPPEIPAATAPHQMVEVSGHRQPDLYTVQPGDSLSLIAARRFCHEPAWQQIHQLNREQIADPRKLRPGMVLRLTGIESRCPATP